MTKIMTILEHYSNLFWNFLPNLALALVMLVLGLWLIAKFRSYLNNALRKSKSDATVVRFLTSLSSVMLKIMLFISIAGLFGIQTTSFIAIFTALAFSLGTALSGNIGHFASGLMILIFRPYKVGDEITVQNFNGIVTDIQVFHTTLITTDNRQIIIPNGQITSSVLTNFSHQNKIRLNIVVNIADESDFEKLKYLIEKVADTCPQIMKDPVCKVLVNSFNKNGLELYIRPWCKPIDATTVHFFLQENIRKTFLENNIKSPGNVADGNTVK